MCQSTLPAMFGLAALIFSAMIARGQEIVPREESSPPRIIYRELPETGRPVIEVQIPERRLPLTAATAQRLEQVSEQNLAGRWLLTLPAGWQQRATIEKLEDGRYRLPGHGNLNGIYVLEGRTLTLVEHDDDPMPNFVWEVLNDNTLRLRIDENRAGANYLGATMGRQIDWDDFADNVDDQAAPHLDAVANRHPAGRAAGSHAQRPGLQ